MNRKTFNDSKHLWISGLRRSGTTAIWQMFRDLKGYRVYDEPFNPLLLKGLPNNHSKKTWDEFIHIWEKDRINFQSSYCSIDPVEELNENLTSKQLKYLKYLSKDISIIDFTRINFKAADVLNKFPNVVILFLFRSPIAFTSSHIINSENTKFLRQSYYKKFFFSSFINFDSWGIQSAIKADKFRSYIDKLNITPRKNLNKLKSHELLLLYWLVNRRNAESLKINNTEKVFIGSYEDILNQNCFEFSNALSATKINEFDLKTSHLRPYKNGYKSSKSLWGIAFKNAGYTDHEIDKFTLSQ